MGNIENSNYKEIESYVLNSLNAFRYTREIYSKDEKKEIIYKIRKMINEEIEKNPEPNIIKEFKELQIFFEKNLVDILKPNIQDELLKEEVEKQAKSIAEEFNKIRIEKAIENAEKQVNKESEKIVEVEIEEFETIFKEYVLKYIDNAEEFLESINEVKVKVSIEDYIQGLKDIVKETSKIIKAKGIDLEPRFLKLTEELEKSESQNIIQKKETEEQLEDTNIENVEDNNINETETEIVNLNETKENNPLIEEVQNTIFNIYSMYNIFMEQINKVLNKYKETNEEYSKETITKIIDDLKEEDKKLKELLYEYKDDIKEYKLLVNESDYTLKLYNELVEFKGFSRHFGDEILKYNKQIELKDKTKNITKDDEREL